jgi:hypothetical protein
MIYKNAAKCQRTYINKILINLFIYIKMNTINKKLKERRDNSKNSILTT